MIKKKNKKQNKDKEADIKYSFISESEVQITVEKEYMKPIFLLIRKLRQSQVDSYSYDFKRRIIPFFLQKYYIWCKEHNHPNIEELLKEIKDKKMSKQKKFELGDVQQLFGFQKRNYNKEIQEELRLTWTYFLQHADEFCIKGYLRIQRNKDNYSRAAQIMLDEMSKPMPFEKFLSQKQ